MKNALFVIAQNKFRDEELLVPLEILKKNKFNCKVASITKDFATGMLGAKIRPDLTVAEAKIEDFDIVIIVGGAGSLDLARHKEVINILQAAKKMDKKIAAICIGPVVLAAANVIEGKNVTLFKTTDSVKAVERAGANIKDFGVVCDGNLVTADGPRSAEEFAKEIVKMFE